jgi:hypothetical protein
MPQQSPAPVEIIRRILPFTTVAAVLALIYLAWVFYARSSENRQLQRQADAKSIEQAQKTYELYGSGQLKIMLFYAVPGVVARGAAAQLCYSVSNAKTVKIDHGVEEIKPSLSRCVPITPVRPTTYTLTAADDQGHRASQSVEVEVR